MTEDGLFAEPYRAVLDRFGSLQVVEANGPAADEAKALGCRVLERHMMGLGTPYATLRADGPDTIIQPEEVRHVLGIFGISVESYLGRD